MEWGGEVSGWSGVERLVGDISPMGWRFHVSGDCCETRVSSRNFILGGGGGGAHGSRATARGG